MYLWFLGRKKSILSCNWGMKMCYVSCSKGENIPISHLTLQTSFLEYIKLYISNKNKTKLFTLGVTQRPLISPQHPCWETMQHICSDKPASHRGQNGLSYRLPVIMKSTQSLESDVCLNLIVSQVHLLLKLRFRERNLWAWSCLPAMPALLQTPKQRKATTLSTKGRGCNVNWTAPDTVSCSLWQPRTMLESWGYYVDLVSNLML